MIVVLWQALLRLLSLIAGRPVAAALGWTLVTHQQEAGAIITGAGQVAQGVGQVAQGVGQVAGGAGQAVAAVGQAAQSVSRAGNQSAWLFLGGAAIIFLMIVRER